MENLAKLLNSAGCIARLFAVPSFAQQHRSMAIAHLENRKSILQAGLPKTPVLVGSQGRGGGAARKRRLTKMISHRSLLICLREL